jgi:pentatricopeptide repeat protein
MIHTKTLRVALSRHYSRNPFHGAGRTVISLLKQNYINDAIEAYKKSPDPAGAACLISNEICYTKAIQYYSTLLNVSEPHDHVFGALVKLIRATKNQQKMSALWKDMKRFNVLPNRQLFSSIISTSTEARDKELLRDLLETWPRLNFQDDAICIQFIRSFTDVEDFNSGFEAYKVLEKPTIPVFMVIIQACRSAQQPACVAMLWNDILKHGINIDSRLCSLLIATCYDINNSVLTQEVFEYSQHLKVSFHSIFKPQLNVIDCSQLIKLFSEAGNFDKAMDVLEYLDQWKMQPNAQLYTSLITACANSALLSYGRKVHAHILASNVAINLVLGNALINMYSKGGDVNEAHKIFMSMKDKDIITWTALLSGCSLVGDGKTALAIFHEMQARCIVPDEGVVTCVLHALSYSGMIDESIKLIESLSFTPTLKIRTCLVDCLARLGRLQEAEEMVLGMHDADCQAWMQNEPRCRTSEKIDARDNKDRTTKRFCLFAVIEHLCRCW